MNSYKVTFHDEDGKNIRYVDPDGVDGPQDAAELVMHWNKSANSVRVEESELEPTQPPY